MAFYIFVFERVGKNRPFFHADADLSEDDFALAMENLDEGGLDTDKTRLIQEYYDKAKKELDDKIRVTMTLHLLRSSLYCDEILFVLNNDVAFGRVAFYTGLSTLMKMLPGTADSEENIGRFAVMHVAYMNDPNEGRILKQWIFDRKGERNGEGRPKADYPYIFIKCFTTRIDDLPMWEMYGDHAHGCCIVTDLGATMKLEKKVFPVYNVCYIKKKSDSKYEIEPQDNVGISPDACNCLTQIIGKLCVLRKYGKALELGKEAYLLTFEQILSRITYLFKNSDYSYENEKRIIYSKMSGLSKGIKHTKCEDKGDIPRLYVLSDIHVHIDEVILGPKFKDAPLKIPYLQESIEKMNKEIGVNNAVCVTYSAIEYR